MYPVHTCALGTMEVRLLSKAFSSACDFCWTDSDADDAPPLIREPQERKRNKLACLTRDGFCALPLSSVGRGANNHISYRSTRRVDYRCNLEVWQSLYDLVRGSVRGWSVSTSRSEAAVRDTMRYFLFFIPRCPLALVIFFAL